MSVPLWAWELARAFWAEAGPAPPFPRRLRPALAMSGFDLTVQELPRLSTRRVREHLRRRGCEFAAGEDRRLRACLVADGCVGWIFLDAGDPDDERGFSLAHELAHFLRHGWQPRRRAAALGALDAFDGRRPATAPERVAAVLRGVRLEPYSHLMERGGGFVPADVRDAEEEADVLAVELLAPDEEVRGRLGGGDRLAAATLYREAFGLPGRAAADAAGRLVEGRIPTPLSDWMRDALDRCRHSAEHGGRDGR